MPQGTFSISTSQQMELVDISGQAVECIRKSGVADGIFYLFNPHTTAGVTINEGADPTVRTDIIAAMRKIVPLDHPYRHLEGNSPAHIMASLFGSSVTIFIEGGKPKLGTWQKIFFCEFDGPRSRKMHWKIQADG